MKVFLRIIFGILIFFISMGLVLYLILKTVPKKTLLKHMPEIHNLKIVGTRVGYGKMHIKIEADIPHALIPFFLDSVRYQGILYGDTISNDTKDMKHFSEKEKGKIYLPVTSKYNDVLRILKHHQGEKAVMGLATQAFVKIPLLGTKEIDIYNEVVFRMPIIPEVKVDKIKIEHFGLNNMIIHVKLMITNPNEIDLVLKNMKYNMTVKKYLTAKGRITQPFHLKSNATTPLEITMKADVDHAFKGLIKIIKGDEWPYIMHALINLKPTGQNIDNIEFTSTMMGKAPISALLNKKE